MKMSASMRKGIRLSSSDSQPRPLLKSLSSIDFHCISSHDLHGREIRVVGSPDHDGLRIAVFQRLAPDPKQCGRHVKDGTEFKDFWLGRLIARNFLPNACYLRRPEFDTRLHRFG